MCYDILMQGHAHPQALSDRELLAALPLLVQGDNERSAELLMHLAEVDARALFATLGFPSMFAFCLKSLGFCESRAGRHIAAARVCRRFPAAFSLIAAGELHLSALCALSRHLTANNASVLFALCARRSIREIEELLAARFPQPNVPDSIRRISPLGTPGAGSECETSNESPLQGTASESPPPFVPSRTERAVVPLSADRFAIHFTADAEFRDLLDAVSDLASHRNPKGQLLSLFKAALHSYKHELLKQRFGIGKQGPRSAGGHSSGRPPDRQERSSPQSPPAPPSSRTQPLPHRRRLKISAARARAVYLRDGEQCTFVSATGQRCSARRFLELDHIVPYVVSLDDSVENLRLRCRAHNQHHARSYFGVRYLRAAITLARQRKRTKRAA